MTEEEKKAIEYLKNNHIPVLRYDNYGNILEPLYYGIEEKETLLNLIEKLKKENEKWKENARIAEENDTTLVLDVNQACKELGISEDTIIADELADKIKEKYILKDKIKEIKSKNIGQYMNFYREIEKLLEEE